MIPFNEIRDAAPYYLNNKHKNYIFLIKRENLKCTKLKILGDTPVCRFNESCHMTG